MPLRQPNTFYTRKFLDIAKAAVSNGRMVVEHETIRGVRDEIMEMMLYSNDLERQLAACKAAAMDQDINIEIKSQDF